MHRLKQGWIGFIGDALLLWEVLRFLWEFRYTRWLLEMANVGQAIDFVLEHWEHPGWIGYFANPLVQFLFIVVGLGLIYWDSKRLNKGWPFLQPAPKQMIFGGLIIIVIGVCIVGYGLWQQSKPTGFMVGVSRVGDSNAHIGGPLSGAKLSKSTIAPPTPDPKRFTPYEKEQRLRAIDEIYSVLVTQLTPVYAEGRKLLNSISAAVADGSAERRLTEYTQKVQSAFDNLNALLKKYNYFSDIVQATTKNTFNDVAATHGVTNLVPEITALRSKVPNDIDWFLMRDTTLMDARNQIGAFERYLAETTPRLQQLRSEIEASEIYSPAASPQPAPQIRPEDKKSQIDWNIEEHPENINFLGLSLGPNGPQANHFWVRGWNRTIEPITSPRAYIRAANTTSEFDGLFNPGNGKLVSSDKIKTIPVGAMIDVTVPFRPDREPIPLSTFLSEFVPFTFFFKSPEISYRQTITRELIEHRIKTFQDAVNAKSIVGPKIQLKGDSDA